VRCLLSQIIYRAFIKWQEGVDAAIAIKTIEVSLGLRKNTLHRSVALLPHGSFYIILLVRPAYEPLRPV